MYSLYLGASNLGTRMGVLFAQNVKRRDIAPRLSPVLELYKDTRQGGENFGDFCHRVGDRGLREDLTRRGSLTQSAYSIHFAAKINYFRSATRFTTGLIRFITAITFPGYSSFGLYSRSLASELRDR